MDFYQGAPKVETMKYFRHPPLALWSVICLAMGALLVAGLSIGRDAELPTGVPDRRDAVADVFSLSSRMTDLNRISTSTALPEWSRETARLADEAAERRLRQGASTGDGLVQALRTMSEDAKNLSEVDLSDTMAIRSGVALLQADADALSAIVAGADPRAVIPMPGEDTAVVTPDPLEPGDGTPEVPALPDTPGDDIPAVPAIPVTPIQPGTPRIPVIPSAGAATVQTENDTPAGENR